MSKKNFKVETTTNGQTPKQDIKHKFTTANITKDKTPTGKVKTLKGKEAVKAAREEHYKNFRIAALTRRAKRMGLSEEQIKVKVAELEEQLKAPANYSVLIWYDPKDYDMMKESIKNEDMAVDIMTSTYLFITVDSEGLATLRSIAPPTAKIYPHVKRKPNVLPTAEPYVRGAKKRTKAEKKALAKAAKKARKAINRQKGHNTNSEAKERVMQFIKNWHAEKRNLHGKKTRRKAFLGTQGSYDALPKRVRVKAKRQNFTKTHVSKARRIIIPKATVKAQVSLKTASTDVKQAA